MKFLYKISGKISLLLYILFLWQLWLLCRFGGVRQRLPVLALCGLAGLICFLMWLVARKKYKDTKREEKSLGKRYMLLLEILAFVISTCCFVVGGIYSAMPYHGRLGSKLQALSAERQIPLNHTNFFNSGVSGILEDLKEELDLPKELYVVNQFQVDFNAEGEIQSIYTFLCGQDEKGEKKTYLVDYDAEQIQDMQVRLQNQTSVEYEADKLLQPMLTILEKADIETQVKAWDQIFPRESYEILYYGRRAFSQAAGLTYIPGDADGDGKTEGEKDFSKLMSGGEMVGYEASLYLPAVKEITPIRYMMEPEYVSAETMKKAEEAQQTQTAKEEETWTLDNSDGSMYFFLDHSTGWRMKVADAAAGSRFYQLECTEDGGETWTMANKDPFMGNIGVTEGVIFYDENFGIAGLTGASQTTSKLYITRDGGQSFAEISLPWEAVTELPKTAQEYGYTKESYGYLNMPQRDGEVMTILAVSQSGNSQGLLFQSQDLGETWSYAGVAQQ